MRRIFHPILFSIYPLLFYYSFNINEVPADALTMPLFITFSSMVITFITALILLKNPMKAGLLVSLTALLFFSYGHAAVPYRR